jgi:hypothetical protein
MKNSGIFFWGFMGSIFVDIGAMEEERRLNGTIPERYRDPHYLLTRLLVALSAGAIAVAQEARQPLAALQIGASAPLILRGLARGIQSARRKSPKVNAGLRSNQIGGSNKARTI